MKAKLQQTTKLTQAHLIALATAAITQVIAFVPAWAPEKQKLIAAAGLVIAAGTFIVHGAALLKQAVTAVVGVVKDLVDAKVSPADLAADAENLVKAELEKVDFTALAHEALSGALSPAAIEATVRQVLTQILAGGGGSAVPVQVTSTGSEGTGNS